MTDLKKLDAPVRDAKGRLLPGHPRLNNQPGHCGGAPKSLATEVKDALKDAEDAMPDIYRVMIARATDPADKDSQRAAEYLSDRIYGKANQPLSGKLSIQTVSWVIGKGYQREPEQLTEGKG